MTILSPPIPPPAWLYRPARARGRVRLVQCDCGFAYAVDARKRLPARCIHCHGEHRRGKSNVYWSIVRAGKEAA